MTKKDTLLAQIAGMNHDQVMILARLLERAKIELPDIVGYISDLEKSERDSVLDSIDAHQRTHSAFGLLREYRRTTFAPELHARALAMEPDEESVW